MKVRTLKPVLLARGLTTEGQELSLEGAELESCLKHGLVEPAAPAPAPAPPPAKPTMPPNVKVDAAGKTKKF